MNVSHFISSRFNARANLPRSIRAMRAVSVAGIAIAVAALIVATSIGRGFEKSYKKALLDFNAHVVVMGTKDIDDIKDFRAAILKLDEGQKKSTVIAMTPFLYREALAVGGGSIGGVVIKGVDPLTLTSVNSMKIETFEKMTLENALRIKKGEPIPSVAGRAFLESFAKGKLPAKIKLLIPREHSSSKNPQKFDDVTSMGSFESGMHEFDSRFILMSLESVQELFKLKSGAITGIELKLDDPDKAQNFAEKINDKLSPKYHAVAWNELNRDLLAAVKLEKLVAAIVMGLMVVVAALNIIAVLVLLTIHRFREIAVLLAIGVGRGTIKNIMIRLGVSISFTGALIGVVVGVGVAFFVGHFGLVPIPEEIYFISALPIDISPYICGMIALFCVGVGVIASSFAARKLSKISASEGLTMAR